MPSLIRQAVVYVKYNTLKLKFYRARFSSQETFKGLLNFTLRTERAISQVGNANENVVFAPISIVGVLGTLLLGSEGLSKEEILETFGVSKFDNDSDTR